MSKKLRITIAPPDEYGSSEADKQKRIDRIVQAIRRVQIQDQILRDARPIRFLWWRF